MSRTCILARNYAAARDWARANDLEHMDWIYIGGVQGLLGVERGTTITALVGWHLAFGPKRAAELVAQMQSRDMGINVVTE